MPRLPMTMREVSFKVTPADRDLISAITERAWAIRARLNLDGSKMDLDMDITAVHANGEPLDLERLLNADPFNFSHDVCGIRNHINRNTGQLERCFVPRFAKGHRT